MPDWTYFELGPDGHMRLTDAGIRRLVELTDAQRAKHSEEVLEDIQPSKRRWVA